MGEGSASSAMANIKRPTCPICKDDSIEAYRPFCSRRCADIDLGRWFKGSYAIAGRSDDDDADQAKTVMGDAPEDPSDR